MEHTNAEAQARRKSILRWVSSPQQFLEALQGTSITSVVRLVYDIGRRRFYSACKNVQKSFALFLSDIALAFVALVSASFLRYGTELYFRPDTILTFLKFLPSYFVICILVFPLSGLYSRNWKYGSISDLFTIFRAVFLSSLLLVCLLFFATRLQQIPRTVILFNALLLVAFLSASRLSFRADELPFVPRLRSPRDKADKAIPMLLVGAGDAADLYLRALRRDRNSTYVPVGCLDVSSDQQGMTLRGVPIVGALADFQAVVSELRHYNQMPRHVVFTEAPSVFGEAASERLLREAEQLGIAVSRLSQMTELKNTKNDNRFELRSIELTDLLERPQAALDRDSIARMIRGRKVLITGAGGSIGSELTLQVAACEPAEVVLIENCEYNLYAIDMELSEKFPDVHRSSYLCNIRRNKRVDQIFDRHQPELVFHAAALKHVPMVELNPCEGVLTNAIGTMNVANAAKRCGVLAMTQISTDKVVNSTSVMGATKRLAELYCQALDIEGFESGAGPRFMTVRFGNVLGSSGSLIPLFKRQLSKGGPLTVTDPEMTRFFMTIREAVELTLQAASYGLEKQLGQGEIFVLDMGEPIKIIDIARRMIRLAGFTPDQDIAIKVIGCRPGEKLYEELFDTDEKRVTSPVPGVLGAVPNPVALNVLRKTFGRLHVHAARGNATQLMATIRELLPSFKRDGSAGSEPDRAPSADFPPTVVLPQRPRQVAAMVETVVIGKAASEKRPWLN